MSSELKVIKMVLEFELADMQCLESYAHEGFTIQDWIECKRKVIERLELTLNENNSN